MPNRKIIITAAAIIVVVLLIILSRCSCRQKKEIIPEPTPVKASETEEKIPLQEKTQEIKKDLKSGEAAKLAAKAMEGIQVKTKKNADGEEVLEVLKGGREVYKVEALPKEKISVNADGKNTRLPQAGLDITGDGKADMVVQVNSAKDSCSNSYEVLSVVDDFKVLAEIRGLAEGVKFDDVDKDGKQEIVGHDCTFMDWWASFGDAPAPKVILRYGDNGYVFAEDLMRKIAPGESEMKAFINKNKDSFVTYIWKYMLDLIYSGNGDTAWRFFDMIDWDPSWEGQLIEDGTDRTVSDKQDFKQAFKEHLTTSVYWPQLKTFNNWEMLDVEM